MIAQQPAAAAITRSLKRRARDSFWAATRGALKRSDRLSNAAALFWLGASLAYAAYCATLGLRQAFAGPYVTQRDAHEQLSWMRRFLDPGLFPNDLIADYFQSRSPPGFTVIYWLAAQAGIDPMDFNKVVPLLLGLALTVFGFRLSLLFFPHPIAGFISMVLLNQHLWMKDDLASATPRAFVFPLLLAFLYFWIRRSIAACGLLVLLQGLIYPPGALLMVCALGLGLLNPSRRFPWLFGSSHDVLLLGVCGLAGLAAAGSYLLGRGDYGPLFTADEARRMIEFGPGGRTQFFVDDARQFWLWGERSGLMPPPWGPPLLWSALALPLLVRLRHRFPLAGEVRSVRPLLAVVLASGALFLLAHAMLFRLYLPNRYSQFSLAVVAAIAAGMALTIILGALARWAGDSKSFARGRVGLVASLVVAVSLWMFLYPLTLPRGSFPGSRYSQGRSPELYSFLAQQPRDTVVASLSEEVNVLPALARVRIVTGRGYAYAYDRGYYGQIRQRTEALIRAQYSPEATVLSEFIRRHGVSYFLVDQGAFTPRYISANPWVRQFQPAAQEAQAALEAGAIPFLANHHDACSVLASPNWALIDAGCVRRQVAWQTATLARGYPEPLPKQSSSMMVPSPWPSTIVPLAGFDKFTKNSSSNSQLVSPLMETGSGLAISPGLNVIVPDVAV